MGAHKAIRATLAVVLATAFPVAAGGSSNGKHCGGKSDPKAVVAWFNAAMRAKNIPADKLVNICVKNQVISWREGNRVERVEVPDAKIAFKPWETTAHTYFGADAWDTSI